MVWVKSCILYMPLGLDNCGGLARALGVESDGAIYLLG
jgi:hypothetical protein